MNLETRIKDSVEKESLEVLGKFVQVQKDAEEVVRVLRILKMPVDQKLIDIVAVGTAVKPIESQVAAVPSPLEETSSQIIGTESKVDPRTVKVQKELENLAVKVLVFLDKEGPTIFRDFPVDLAPSSYKLRKALSLLRKQDKVSTRTEGFQGSTLWYSFEYPVSMEQLKKYLETFRPGDEIKANAIIDQFKLPSEAKPGVVTLLRKFVSQGVLTKRSGLFYKEKLSGKHVKETNKRNGNFAGGGVATSGDQLSSNKEVRELVRSCVNQGAQVSTGGKHISVKYNNQTTTIGRTPNPHGLREDKANLKRMGLNI